MLFGKKIDALNFTKKSKSTLSANPSKLESSVLLTDMPSNAIPITHEQMAQLVKEINLLDDHTIKPFIDYNSGTLHYPILAKIGIEQNNVEFFENLVHEKILQKNVYEKLIVCPLHPETYATSVKLYCPKCHSINVEKLNLFEHKKCGFISESKNFNFTNKENSECPSCKRQIVSYEKEIRIPAMWYECDDCHEKFDNVVIALHCRKYEHDFETNAAQFVPIHAYTLKSSDVSNVEQSSQLKNEIVKLLQEFNYKAKIDETISGKSGNFHVIPIFGIGKNPEDTILIFIKNKDRDFDESDIQSVIIPSLDVGIKNVLLITSSFIKTELEDMIKQYGITVINNSDHTKILSEIETFVFKRYQSDSSN